MTTEANRLHQESIVIDGLNASHFRDPVIVERLEAGRVTAVNMTVAAWHGRDETINSIADHLALFEKYAARVLPVREVSDIYRAKAMGRVGVIMGFQGGEPIEDNLKLLSVYRELGVRIIQLTYNATNHIGSGYRVAEDTGLSGFGREAIAEMNRLGILIDLSHCGDRTTRETIEVSRRPVSVNHANSRRFFDSSRNKDPEALKALAAKGGVVGAIAFAPVLTAHRHATLSDYIGAIDDLVDLVGIDHVGLGPDFMEEMPRATAEGALKGFTAEGSSAFFSARPLDGFASVSEMANVTAALLARGYNNDQVRKIMGSNWLRFYEHSWRPESVREVPVTVGPPEPPDPKAVKADSFSTVSVPARQS
jgi:membrane dipeptidase